MRMSVCLLARFMLKKFFRLFGNASLESSVNAAAAGEKQSIGISTNAPMDPCSLVDSFAYASDPINESNSKN